MIYTLDGTPLTEALPLARMRYAERQSYRRPPQITGERIEHDKLGDPYRILRAAHVHRPGAGYVARLAARQGLTIEKLKQAATVLKRQEPSLWHAVKDALLEHGSQRKAAAALGISLGKLQRTLKMVPA